MGKKAVVDWSTVFSCIYYGLLITLLLMGLTRSINTPMAMRFWRGLSQLCYSTAYMVGSAGLSAEKAYWRAVEARR